MAAGKTDGPALTDSEDEQPIKDTTDCTPLRGKRQTEECGRSKTFGYFDAALVLISLVAYLVDSLTDILVSVEYFQGGHYVWAGLTLGFVAVPSIVIQGFSLRWYQADGKVHGCRPWLIHIFQLQPLERYMCVLLAGMEARSSRDPEVLQAYYYQQNDVCMLRLFETFLESAPQLTLQVYIMIATNDAGWLTGFSACVSLVALGWAVAIYNHALRQAHRDNYHLQWPGLILQTVWHMGTVAARVCALVAFASLYKAWLFLFMGLHWLLMTVWVVLQRTDFCPTNLEERVFNAVVGTIYCYCFFSLKEGQTRWRMSVFYTVMFIENVILIGVWYPFRAEDGWTTGAIVSVAFGGFFLGVLCMLVYYRFCHPSGPIYCLGPSDVNTDDNTETFKRKTSAIHQLQVDLVPRTSTALLPRRAHLKPQTSLAMAIQPVEFKEICTPSQLTPIKHQPGCRRVIDYDKTFALDDSSLFQHYSIEASQCMVVSRCATLNFEGVDLTQACLSERADRTAMSMRNRLPEVQEYNCDDSMVAIPIYENMSTSGSQDSAPLASDRDRGRITDDQTASARTRCNSLDDKTIVRWKKSPKYYSPPSFESESPEIPDTWTHGARQRGRSLSPHHHSGYQGDPVHELHFYTPDKLTWVSPIPNTVHDGSYNGCINTPVRNGLSLHPDVVPTHMSTPYPLGMEMHKFTPQNLALRMEIQDTISNKSVSDCGCGADICLVCSQGSQVAFLDLTQSLVAPLAEPEVTWSESLCEMSLNESLYDNMPNDAHLCRALSPETGLPSSSLSMDALEKETAFLCGMNTI